MFKWLTDTPPTIPAFKQCLPSRPIVPHLIRPVTPSDYESCERLYRTNEATSFPAGYFSQFSEWLRSDADLILVGEFEGRVISLGGISMYKNSNGVVLLFGVVDPTMHRSGLGTAMLLARLSALPPPSPTWIVSGLLTGRSEGFYKRFGFEDKSSLSFEDGMKASLCQASVSGSDVEEAAQTLLEAGLQLEIPRKVKPSLSVHKVFRF